MKEDKDNAIGLNWFWYVMFLILFTLKLLDKIQWSWWWVTAPLWAPIGLLLLISFFCLILASLVSDRSN